MKMKADLDKRIYVTNESKAVQLTPEYLMQVNASYIRYSLQLQAQFGLRREIYQVQRPIRRQGR